jgi:cytochrome c556
VKRPIVEPRRTMNFMSCRLRIMRWTPVSLLFAALLLATACQARPEPEDAVAADAARHAEDTRAPVFRDATPSPSPSHAGHGAGQEPQALLPIMLGMSADLAGLLQAMWLDDYDGLSERARRLAQHAPISAAEIARVESVLGAEMKAFEAADAVMHSAAVRMSEAADARNIDRLLEDLAAVQRGCVECHNTFRTRLRTTAR